MSLLQEYRRHIEYLGKDRIEAIGDYIVEREKEGEKLAYSDIVYDKDNWERFDKWYKTIYNEKYAESTRGNKEV